MSDDLSSQTGILIGIALTVAFALLVVFGLESKCERQHNVADCRPSITFEAAGSDYAARRFCKPDRYASA